MIHTAVRCSVCVTDENDVKMHNALVGLNLDEYRAPRVLQQRYTRTPGIVPVVQKSQKFRVRVWGSYRTYRSSGYGYASVTELAEVPGRYKHAVPVPRVFVARAYKASGSSGYGY